MAQNLQVTGESPTVVAYALMYDILYATGRMDGPDVKAGVSEAEILALFSDCLAATRGAWVAPE